jgi:hypothetical protein
MHRGPQTEDKRVQDSHSQPYAQRSSIFLRGIETSIALSLRERVTLNPKQRFRLGVGLSNFHDPDDAFAHSVLFE